MYARPIAFLINAYERENNPIKKSVQGGSPWTLLKFSPYLTGTNKVNTLE